MSDTLPSEERRYGCFLSLPHESSTVRDALRAMVERIGGESYFVIVSGGDTIRKEIQRAMSASSILIADLSSPPNSTKGSPKGPRPAIMWELGRAHNSGMETIILCQKKDKQFVPPILADYHIVLYDINQIGTMIKEAEAAVTKAMHRGRANEETVFQSICYVDRKSAGLEQRYLKARDTIKILELNLETVEKQVPTIIQALQESPKLSVQIMTLNPFSKFAEDRAQQLGQLALPYRRKLFEKIKGTHDKLSTIPDNRWALRIFDTFPTQIMFQIDHSLIHSMISLGKESRTMLHFEVQKAQPNASDTFEAHFNQLWSGSVEYPGWCKQNAAAVEELMSPGHSTEPEEKVVKEAIVKPSQTKVDPLRSRRPKSG